MVLIESGWMTRCSLGRSCFAKVYMSVSTRADKLGQATEQSCQAHKSTYDFIVIVADLLSHQLVRPGIDLVAAVALDSRNDKRHVG